MKALKMALMIALLLGPLCVISQRLHAAVGPETPAAAAQKMISQDSGTKAQIKKYKQDIAEEREGILAAGRRLKQVKKTGDKAQIEQVKKEVDGEIKERKAKISSIKDEIAVLQQGRGSLAPSAKERSKEAGG